MISCLCPTYNRAPGHLHLLEEAVESFLRQRLCGIEAELIILNDTPGQTLRCNAPGVRIVNVGRRYDTLGEKRNALVALAHGDMLLPWDDDDISLPWRTAQAWAFIALRGYGYFNPGASWYAHGDTIQYGGGYCHNASAYTREAWLNVGGYEATSGDEDAKMDRALRRRYGANAPLLPEQWQYVYRWGVSPRHISGKHPHDEHYKEIGREAAVKGAFELRPKWSRDYEAAVARLTGVTSAPSRTR